MREALERMERQAMRYDQIYAFLQLGLSPDANEQEIKRTYAQKIKDCNPETDSENWMRLHNAYKLALSALRKSENTPDADQSLDVPLIEPSLPPVDEHENAGSEYDGLFDNLESLARNAALQEEQYQRNYEAAMRVARAEQEKRHAEYEATVRAAKRVQAEKARKPLEQRIRKLCRQARWKKLESEDLKNLFQSPDYRTVSGEAWSVELLYPLFQRRIYEGCLTPEAKVSLSLQLCELYRMQHPECRNAFALMPKLVADTRAHAEKTSKTRSRNRLLFVVFLLLAVAYLPDLFPSGIKYAQSADMYTSMTMQECIRRFTGTNGYWRKEGDTVVVSAGVGDRTVHAAFTLDKNKSNANFPIPFYSKPGIWTRRVYVCSFQVGSYVCKGNNDLEDFCFDIMLREQGVGFIRIPWKPGSGDAAREFIRNMDIWDSNAS